jgi:hypothetical protein
VIRQRFLARAAGASVEARKALWHSFVFRPQADNLVLVDKSLDRFIAISYFVLACWGVAAMIGHAPAVQAVSGQEAAFWWAAAITFVSLSACIGTSFRRWSLEMYALSSLIGLIGLYPLSVLVLVILRMGDASVSSIIATSYMLVLPIWRLRFIIRRTRRTGETHG